MRKVCVVTGTRAEYGLLFWTLKALKEDQEIELQIIATGMHLSPEFGLTYKAIEKDGFKLDKKIEMLLSSDTPTGVSKSTGLGIIGFASAFEELNPDIVLILGDRFEIFSAASAAMMGRIPIAHCHGGETSEGVIDEQIRHSITKMSHLHFTCTESYRNRVIQLGEAPKNTFNVGGLGIENINKLNLLSLEEFENSIGYKLNKRNLIITFHPVTLENSTSKEQFKKLLNALDLLKDTHLIFTFANADSDGRIVNELITEYVAKNPDKSVCFQSLGQLRYLSALKHVDGVVGNSSSGLIEAPSFNLGTINIGDRQKGRIKASSVIDCGTEQVDISKALEQLFSDDFQKRIFNTENPYGTGDSSQLILEQIKNVNLNEILKKKFHNLNS